MKKKVYLFAMNSKSCSIFGLLIVNTIWGLYNKWVIFILFFIADEINLSYFADCPSRTSVFTFGLSYFPFFMLLDFIINLLLFFAYHFKPVSSPVS